MISIACFPEDLILPVIYATVPAHVLRRVSLARIMPTQAELIPSILDYYRQRTRMTDDAGALPYGIRFADSATVYLTNGHHRWYVCRERGRQRLRMWVHDHPLSLKEAILARQHPRVAFRKVKPSPPLHAPVQLQLQFA